MGTKWIVKYMDQVLCIFQQMLFWFFAFLPPHLSPAQLCSQMEQLERENQQLKAGAAREGAAQAGSLVDGELLRLQAENTALQKNVAGVWTPCW